MQTLPALESLGRRICICGPSNAGKSTLADAIGRKLDIPAVHLDQFRHLPDTNWVQRPDADFRQLHDEATLGDGWAMDGNYSSLMPQRMARATGIILLGGNRWAGLLRYFRRTLFQRNRLGSLPGAQDSLKWEMIHWILIVQPHRRADFHKRLKAYPLPLVQLSSMREVNQAYAAWDLQRNA